MWRWRQSWSNAFLSQRILKIIHETLDNKRGAWNRSVSPTQVEQLTHRPWVSLLQNCEERQLLLIPNCGILLQHCSTSKQIKAIQCMNEANKIEVWYRKIQSELWRWRKAKTRTWLCKKVWIVLPGNQRDAGWLAECNGHKMCCFKPVSSNLL